MPHLLDADKMPRRETFSTIEVAEKDRIDFWQGKFGSIWGEVDVRAENRPLLFGRAETAKLSYLRVNRLDLRGMSFQRRATTQLSEPFLSLGFPQSGRALITRKGRQWLIQPGSVYLMRHGEPDVETAISEQYKTVNVLIPQSVLQSRYGVISDAYAWTLERGTFAGVLRGFVGTIWRELPLTSAREGHQIANQLCDMLAALMMNAASSGSDSFALRSCRTRALHIMRDKIEDLDLSPTTLAADVGVSVGYLHKVFAAGNTSVMKEVRRLRLDKARQLLSAANVRRVPISQIASQCGFRSLQDFSRVFRQTFGIPPTHLRHQFAKLPQSSAVGEDRDVEVKRLEARR